MVRGGSGWVEELGPVPRTVGRLRVTGAIESSLYDALDNAVADTFLPAVERRSLACAMADVYDWEVDFTRDIRPGDRFTVLCERLESPEGERRFGRVLAARVDVAGTPSYAFYFEDSAARVTGFYDERGRSLRRAFLRAPLQFRRVSSRFGVRFHPLLHMWRAHEGVDFAAAYGTPVRATADGMVIRVGRADGACSSSLRALPGSPRPSPRASRTPLRASPRATISAVPAQARDVGTALGSISNRGALPRR